MHAYYEANEDGFRKLADALLDDDSCYYVLAVSDSNIAYRFGVWAATHTTTVAAPKDLAKKRGGVAYSILLERRRAGHTWAFSESMRPGAIKPVLTMKDPFAGSPR